MRIEMRAKAYFPEVEEDSLVAIINKKVVAAVILENQEITKEGDDYLPAVEDFFGNKKQNKIVT